MEHRGTRKFMAAIFQNTGLFKSKRGERKAKPKTEAVAQLNKPGMQAHDPDFAIDPTDPLYQYFLNSPGATALETIKLEEESPALSILKASGVKVVVPLVSQGELVGLIRLGERKSQQEYSRERPQ